jgi:tetrahydromethanopterin S-methyltransferase subunit G
MPNNDERIDDLIDLKKVEAQVQKTIQLIEKLIGRDQGCTSNCNRLAGCSEICRN